MPSSITSWPLALHLVHVGYDTGEYRALECALESQFREIAQSVSQWVDNIIFFADDVVTEADLPRINLQKIAETMMDFLTAHHICSFLIDQESSLSQLNKEHPEAIIKDLEAIFADSYPDMHLPFSSWDEAPDTWDTARESEQKANMLYTDAIEKRFWPVLKTLWRKYRTENIYHTTLNIRTTHNPYRRNAAYECAAWLVGLDRVKVVLFPSSGRAGIVENIIEKDQRTDLQRGLASGSREIIHTEYGGATPLVARSLCQRRVQKVRRLVNTITEHMTGLGIDPHDPNMLHVAGGEYSDRCVGNFCQMLHYDMGIEHLGIDRRISLVHPNDLDHERNRNISGLHIAYPVNMEYR